MKLAYHLAGCAVESCVLLLSIREAGACGFTYKEMHVLVTEGGNSAWWRQVPGNSLTLQEIERFHKLHQKYAELFIYTMKRFIFLVGFCFLDDV